MLKLAARYTEGNRDRQPALGRSKWQQGAVAEAGEVGFGRPALGLPLLTYGAGGEDVEQLEGGMSAAACTGGAPWVRRMPSQTAITRNKPVA